MSPELNELYRRLADGQRHNGAALAEEMGVSRAAIWKRIESLRQIGLPISGTAGGGYRIDNAIELLDRQAIEDHLGSCSIQVEVVGAVDSTNARLAGSGNIHGRALVAEAQKSGRGRRGRNWLSPPGGIYLSLGRNFESGLAGLSALSLMVGLSAARVINQQCKVPAKVKWPNDLVVDDAKLGGCLVEISGAAEGPCQAIIGIGINLNLPGSVALDQPFTSLSRHADAIARNHLIGALLVELDKDLLRLDRQGFEPFREQWRQFDSLAGRQVRVAMPGGRDINGQAEGIDEQGRLLVRERDRVHPLGSGQVSVRVR